jgi:hypothetical protein
VLHDLDLSIRSFLLIFNRDEGVFVGKRKNGGGVDGQLSDEEFILNLF